MLPDRESSRWTLLGLGRPHLLMMFFPGFLGVIDVFSPTLVDRL